MADTTPHSRHRKISSTSSSSSSSTISSSSLTPSPSPSPKSITSSSCSSSIPFSWEHHPGIPKNRHLPKNPSPPLPLPPAPFRSVSMPLPSRYKPRPVTVTTVDPFAVALAHCTKDDDEEMCGPRLGAGVRRQWWLSGGVGFLDMYGCKSAISVAETTIMVRRSASGSAVMTGKTTGRSLSSRAGRR